ncbi:MAG: tetratricopeptide repeat protein [Elusimicrobiota bacterium]
MIILIIVIILIISCFIIYKFYQKKKETERIKKIETLIADWKLPEKNNLADYEMVVRILTTKPIKATGFYLISEFYFQKIDRTELELKKLKDIYFELIENYPKFEKMDDVLFKLANIYFFDYFNFIESIKFYEKLLKEYPNSKWQKVAAERLKLIKSAYPNEEGALKKYALAEKYFEVQEFNKTIEFLKSILTSYPHTKLAGSAAYFLGDIFFFKKNDYTTALHYYSLLVERFSPHRYTGHSQFKIGDTYRKLHKYNEAITAYKKFLENYNDFQYTDYAQYYIAQCYEEMKDWVYAIRTYKLLISSYPESIWVGIALSKIKNLEKLVK